MERSINKIITDLYLGSDLFTINESYEKVLNERPQVNKESIRARIYEAISEGTLKRLARGVFQRNNCLVINGNGRDLNFIKDNTIDCIITDHPYDLSTNKGGNRNFADKYDCFKYQQSDFDDKARVLKQGHFLVEFLPEESGDNWEYLNNIKKMAKQAGLIYYCKVPWKKGDFISNCGRKSKNTEDVVIFSKGIARSLRPDAKKDKAEPNIKHYMSGAKGMLPTCFNYSKPPKNEQLHQAEKPVKLLESILDYVTLPEEVILDQFAGSGSTGVAAKSKNRYAILIETSEDNISIINQRLIS